MFLLDKCQRQGKNITSKICHLGSDKGEVLGRILVTQFLLQNIVQ